MQEPYEITAADIKRYFNFFAEKLADVRGAAHLAELADTSSAHSCGLPGRADRRQQRQCRQGLATPVEEAAGSECASGPGLAQRQCGSGDAPEYR
jgi:hypothetical protein